MRPKFRLYGVIVMAELKPFRALRYTDKAGSPRELTCPPYDIISDEQRTAYLEKNPYNVIRLELPREGEDPYAEASHVLEDWLREEILRCDREPALYIYEEEFSAYGQRKKVKGVIARVKVEDFSAGVVLPHEETLSKAKADRFNLMKATHCNFSQIYSLYMDPEHETLSRIDRLSACTPRHEFDDGSVIHRLWVVNDPVAIAAICEDFAERKLYIADGHHRYETAIHFRDWCHEQGLCPEGGEADYVMMMLVDMEHEGLVVFPTHRLVRDLPGFDEEALLRGCADYFDLERRTDVSNMEAVLSGLYNEEKKAFGYYGGGEEWVLLTLKDISVMEKVLPDKSAASQGLDVSVLHSLVLEKVLGIDAENMAKQINLTYTRSFEEAVSSVREGKSQCAFILNPTRVTEIRDVAAAGEKMPQKSTYFYPKLITGLVMNKMDF